jgi:AAA+ superfamily predicted ATPase
MGKTQRAVADLFSQSIAESAATGPTIVLLDEVETLAVDRTKLSLDANPVDIHRATDAVLVQLDLLADQYPNLLILATSNFPQAVDAAFTSRCDLVMEIPLPDGDACRRILEDCLIGLAKTFPKLKNLTASPQFDRCAQEFIGLDGRTIRKVVVNAMAASHTTALDPNEVTLKDLSAAARMATTLREKAGKKP